MGKQRERPMRPTGVTMYKKAVCRRLGLVVGEVWGNLMVRL